MTKLLVEFPNRGMASAAGPPTTSKSAAKAPRPVRFASMSSLTLTPPVSREELAARWYTKQERDYQKAKLKHDVRRLSRAFAQTPMDSIGEKKLYECVGMEVRLALVLRCHSQ